VKIVVLVKQVPDTWGERRLDLDTGWLDRASGDAVIDEIDERALEVALSYQDANDAEVVALTMGPDSAKDMLRKALAMGADSAIHIVDDQLAGADAMRTSRVIAAALTKFGFDLVIAGNESTDGRGGVIPTLVAEHLGMPQATFLNSVAITAGSVSGERGTENGTMSVRAPLPAVISVTERSAEPRFPSFKGIMRAKRKPIETPPRPRVPGTPSSSAPASARHVLPAPRSSMTAPLASRSRTSSPPAT
jgi:electron transfer flavoprotein beta subunit